MTYLTHIVLRAVGAIIAVILMSVVMFQAASAQPPTVYDIKVATGTDELPEGGLTFAVQFNNGDQHTYSTTTEGVSPAIAIPPGATDVVAVQLYGIWYPVQSHQLLRIPMPWGGCWCLCLQWRNWWGIRWPRLFWYYDPCCP